MSDSEKTNKNYLNQTLMNGLKILEQFDENNTELTVKEVGEATDLNNSSVWRLVYTLEYMGYLNKMPGKERYTLGFKGLKFAKIILNKLRIRGIAIPYLKKLALDLNINVNLTVLGDNEVVLISTFSAPDIPDNHFHIGRSFPLYCSSSGKLLCANLSQDKRNKIINNLKFKELTKNTITNKEELKENLKIIKERGYAIDDEEYIMDTKCLAVPLKDNTGKVIASMSVSSRKLNYKEEINIMQYLNDVSTVANKISHELGYGLYTPNK